MAVTDLIPHPLPPGSPLTVLSVERTATAVESTVTDEMGRRAVLAQPANAPGPYIRADIEAITESAATALKAGLPLVVVFDRIALSLTDGMETLAAWGRFARVLSDASGIVPKFAIVDAEVIGPAAIALGLFDFVVVTESAAASVSHPAAVAEITGIDMALGELAGPRVLLEESAVAVACAVDLEDAMAVVDEILSFLPDNNNELPPRVPTYDAADRLAPALNEVIPETSNVAYDVKLVIEEIVDADHEFVELWSSWARNLVVGFARIDGRAVGIVANQTSWASGVLDIPTSHKGARFVQLCDSFNVPLLTMVDTSGFMPGKDIEWEGIIRHGAQMAFAYINATVPRVNLTLRKSYGGAYIVMDSKRIGNDITFAWPTAEIAVLGARGAVEILHRRDVAEADDPVSKQAELEVAYNEKWLNPYVAADRGIVDSVIDPAESRMMIAAALEMLESKREDIPARKHDNMPL